MPLREPETAQAPLRTKYGDFTMHDFSWSPNEQDNVLVLEAPVKARPPLVRIQSACYSGEIFSSLDCDCHWQLETSLTAIQKDGGLFVYMLKDGRGAGLLTKTRGLALSSTYNIDTADAYSQLGVQPDPREYEQVVFVLKHFGIRSLRLLTNNPRKVDGLTAARLSVERVPLESEPTPYNRDYLRAKATKLGHMMVHFGTGSLAKKEPF